jgi:hypothetical protein
VPLCVLQVRAPNEHEAGDSPAQSVQGGHGAVSGAGCCPAVDQQESWVGHRREYSQVRCQTRLRSLRIRSDHVLAVLDLLENLASPVPVDKAVPVTKRARVDLSAPLVDVLQHAR